MFRPFSAFIGLRFLKAKRKSHFISFISISSIIGIGLGVAALITVLSVMNGFDREIKTSIFNMTREITAQSINEQSLAHWEKVQSELKQFPDDVIASSPFVDGLGIVVNSRSTIPIRLRGINPELEESVLPLSHLITEGSSDSLQPGEFNILLGNGLAKSLGAKINDKISVLIPQSSSVSVLGLTPRSKRFTVSGMFAIENLDSNFAIIELNDAQAFLNLGDNVSGLAIKTPDLYQAESIARRLDEAFPYLYFYSWTSEQGKLFNAVKLEKTMMFLLLLLIIIVAAFNLISSLVMTVVDKESDIAILRTLGARPGHILQIFIIQGSFAGLTGTLFGLFGGLLLASNVSYVIEFLKLFVDATALEEGFYFTTEVPSEILFSDVFSICLIAVGLSFLATLYPAWRAAKVQPAEALRYE